MEIEEREVRLRTGTCPSCAKEFAFVEGPETVARLGSVAGSEAAGSETESGMAVATTGLECEECGSPLAVAPGTRGSLKVVCEECERTTVYVPRTSAPRFERGRPARGGFEEGAPRSRPCRKCGAPLRFSTQEDGTLVGECESCGNRFELPARSDRRGGGPDRRRDSGYRSRGGRRAFQDRERPERGGYGDNDRRRKRRYGSDRS